jgi:hypothetical protein
MYQFENLHSTSSKPFQVYQETHGSIVVRVPEAYEDFRGSITAGITATYDRFQISLVLFPRQTTDGLKQAFGWFESSTVKKSGSFISFNFTSVFFFRYSGTFLLFLSVVQEHFIYHVSKSVPE